MHSLPLSFVIHTGVIGTLLGFEILVLMLAERLLYDPAIDPAERRFGPLMLIVLAHGTISVFMT